MTEDKKGFNRGLRPKHVILDEVTKSEYFSRDIQFDWPEAYEPKYPLTTAEMRLQALNECPGLIVAQPYNRLRLVPPLLDPEEWVKEGLTPIVREELDRAEADDKKET
jgi:hypothetical protein